VGPKAEDPFKAKFVVVEGKEPLTVPLHWDRAVATVEVAERLRDFAFAPCEEASDKPPDHLLKRPRNGKLILHVDAQRTFWLVGRDMGSEIEAYERAGPFRMQGRRTASFEWP
jgi:hypothetical protein